VGNETLMAFLVFRQMYQTIHVIVFSSDFIEQIGGTNIKGTVGCRIIGKNLPIKNIAL
jgi:hypothetical protein